ncbi:MAG: alpha/beta fold hydrolase [Bacteroidota bacterium]
MLSILLYGLLGIFLVVYVIFRFFLNFEPSEEDLQATFNGKAYQPEHISYNVGDETMHYVAAGPQDAPVMLLVHGSPGSWNAYASYLADSNFQSKYRMISVDRIGYGKSTFGHANSSLAHQAHCLMPLLESIPDSTPVMAVGHSYGVPVLLRLAMDHPKALDGMVLLAGLSDPEYEKRPAILGPFRSKLLRWLLPPDLDVSNREIFPLKGELELMMPMWENISIPTAVIQGGKDMLVNPKHADFIEQKITNSEVSMHRLPEANHFIPWSHYDTCYAVIEGMAEEVLMPKDTMSLDSEEVIEE